MPKSLRIANVVQLVLFGLMLVANLMFTVSTVGGELASVVTLLPPGLALIAGRADSKRLASWASLVVNTLWALLLGVLVAFIATKAPVKLAAVPVFAFVVLALWNVAVAWLRLFPAEEAGKRRAVEPTL
ncbi:hypothetical protein [Roseateles chitinivorans]|uniref:hypothetical protein n=1 Tax=Roseateles chitinivorans TaxID=2917965 RepID=UPI003D6781F3